MSKRDPKTDIPRRIYASTLDRIDLHISSEKVVNGKRKKIKKNFNEFLIKLLDVYEGLENAEVFYTNDLFEDIESARGAAILRATKERKSLKDISEPMAVIISE